MTFNKLLTSELKEQGADFVTFVDVSNLSDQQNKKYPNALLFGVALSPAYLQTIINATNHVEKMKNPQLLLKDEFHLKETKTDRLADYIALFISEKGYDAYSQSEEHLSSTGFYDEKNKQTPLPHKTIAGLAGLGWIGKHNLLITAEYGSAISMCTVLTNAPLNTVLNPPQKSLCGACHICKDVCSVNALGGVIWDSTISRDELVNVNRCNSCLKCLAFCPYTLNYMVKKGKKQN